LNEGIPLELKIQGGGKKKREDRRKKIGDLQSRGKGRVANNTPKTAVGGNKGKYPRSLGKAPNYVGAPS